MTKEEYLLALLRASLRQTDAVAVGDCKLLTETLTLAREHTMAALIAHPFISGQAQLAADKKDVARRQALVMRMLQLEQSHRVTHDRFSHLLHDLAALFRKHEVSYAVFKGWTVASHYPVPYLRTMGDIDFYVVPKDFLRAVDVVEREWGVTVERDDRDKHYSFDYHGVRFEMHHRIETFGSGKAQRMFDHWMEEEVCGSSASIDAGGEQLSVLPSLADVAVVFKHMFNHLLVEGVGLRQVADLAVLLNGYESEIDKGELRTRLMELGYLKAFDVTVAMLGKYLFLSCAKDYAPLTDADRRHADRMFKMIMESGNFGRKAYSHHVGGMKRSMETAYRAFRHCLFAFRLIPSEMLAFIPRRIGITMRKYKN